jgi:SAM-dependent methyltransferase
MPVSPVHKIGELIDLDSMHGIEIGALHSPRLPRDHPNVKYLDHATRDELAAKYADNPDAAPMAAGLVPVDHVWQPGLRLAEIIGDDAPLGFVIASHVIEHVPDPIGWLAQIAEILADGGILALVVPDRRFTFDVNRPETTAAELVEAMLEGRQMPSPQQTFSHDAGFVGTVDALAVWEGLDLSSVRRTDVGDPEAFALERARRLDAAVDYVDVHCSVFTPDSFLSLLQTFVRLGLVDFEVVRFYTTEYGHYEFFVTLRKVSDPSPADRERMAASFDPFYGLEPELPPVPAGDGPEEEPVDPDTLAPEPDEHGRYLMNLSPAEVTAVLAKREAAKVARGVVRRVRRR